MKTGIHADVEEIAYHADPAFSQSQAKVLLESPARYRWRLTHPAAPHDCSTSATPCTRRFSASDSRSSPSPPN